jgi:hypothetical protein
LNNETFCNCFKRDGEGVVEGGRGNDLANAQSKAILDCHHKSLPVQWIYANKMKKRNTHFWQRKPCMRWKDGKRYCKKMNPVNDQN